jgi:hypothetical protein
MYPFVVEEIVDGTSCPEAVINVGGRLDCVEDVPVVKLGEQYAVELVLWELSTLAAPVAGSGPGGSIAGVDVEPLTA